MTGPTDPIATAIAGDADLAERRAMLRHVAALSLTKAGDGLADAKLALSWLMTALGAPALMVGLLVPLREAGSLLPQLPAAAWVRAVARRKRVWAVAAAVQGAALLVMALAGTGLRGAAAGAVVLAALSVLALARSVASVSYKDVLGKTVAQGRRGTVTGTATSVAAVVTIGFALALISGLVDRMALVIVGLVLSGCAFLVASVILAGLAEKADDTGPPEPAAQALGAFAHLRADRELARFVLARALLTATALAPPFVVMLSAGAAEAALDSLGAMILASALAALVSGRVWGRLADRSSRLVLAAAGLSGAAGMVLAVALAAAGLHALLPLALFALMVAHHGVRIARATHLVDMAPADLRATYTALANTVIGLALMGAGVFGAIAATFGAGVTLALFAAMALAGALVARGLAEPGGS